MSNTGYGIHGDKSRHWFELKMHGWFCQDGSCSWKYCKKATKMQQAAISQKIKTDDILLLLLLLTEINKNV